MPGPRWGESFEQFEPAIRNQWPTGKFLRCRSKEVLNLRNSAQCKRGARLKNIEQLPFTKLLQCVYLELQSRITGASQHHCFAACIPVSAFLSRRLQTRIASASHQIDQRSCGVNSSDSTLGKIELSLQSPAHFRTSSSKSAPNVSS